MRLYKFIDEGAIVPVLEKRELRITTLSALNDLFDCTPRFLDENGNDQDEVAAGLAYYIGEMLGMICYSRHHESLLLWAHYASKHTGIAVAFEFSEEDFSAPRPIDYWYDNKRPVVRGEHINDGDGNIFSDTPGARSILQKLCVKGRDWFYEQEYRRLIPIWNREKRDDGFYYESFPEGSFRGILRGSRCPLSATDLAKMYGNSNAIVHSATRSKDANEITFFPDIDLKDIRVGTEIF